MHVADALGPVSRDAALKIDHSMVAINSARVAFPPMRPLLENGSSDSDASLIIYYDFNIMMITI